MPRSKPEKCIEHRITLGNVERDFLKSIKTSERIGVLDPYLNDPEGLLRSPWALIGLAGVLALILEMTGFNTPIPMPSEIREWIKDLRQRILDRKVTIAVALDEIKERRGTWKPVLDKAIGRRDADALLVHWDKWADIAADKLANRSSRVAEESPYGGPGSAGGRYDRNYDGLHDVTGEPI